MINPLFLISASTGLIFLLAGFMLFRFPPKKINGLYGYRTPASMKNQERWDFAQVYSGREMMTAGVIQLIAGLTSILIPLGEETGIISSLLLLLGVVAYLIIQTERKIKQKFG